MPFRCLNFEAELLPRGTFWLAQMTRSRLHSNRNVSKEDVVAIGSESKQLGSARCLMLLGRSEICRSEAGWGGSMNQSS
jgi:hypothetical protein